MGPRFNWVGGWLAYPNRDEMGWPSVKDNYGTVLFSAKTLFFFPSSSATESSFPVSSPSAAAWWRRRMRRMAALVSEQLRANVIHLPPLSKLFRSTTWDDDWAEETPEKKRESAQEDHGNSPRVPPGLFWLLWPLGGDFGAVALLLPRGDKIAAN